MSNAAPRDRPEIRPAPAPPPAERGFLRPETSHPALSDAYLPGAPPEPPPRTTGAPRASQPEFQRTIPTKNTAGLGLVWVLFGGFSWFIANGTPWIAVGVTLAGATLMVVAGVIRLFQRQRD